MTTVSNDVAISFSRYDFFTLYTARKIAVIRKSISKNFVSILRYIIISEATATSDPSTATANLLAWK